MKDGIRNQCKTCVLNAVKNNPKQKEHRRAITERNREVVIKYLEEHPCEDCGLTDPRVMEFDHLDRKVKTANISTLVTSASLETLYSELSKCRVLCANCHRIHTGYQLGYWWTK